MGSMEVTIFLARFLGLYFLIYALILLLRKNQMEITAKEFMSSDALIALAGSINLALGLAIIFAHPNFESNWTVVINVMALLMIIFGVLRIAFPRELREFCSNSWDICYWSMLIFLIAFGITLTYFGFSTP